jgi:soluble lytic murein transglycosylase
VQLGTYYLSDIQRGLDNSPVLATAAYNAGPGRARAWKGNTPLEGAIYAESIPFDETRDYVKKVMANATFYAMVFKHKQPRLTLKQRIGIIPAR